MVIFIALDIFQIYLRSTLSIIWTLHIKNPKNPTFVRSLCKIKRARKICHGQSKILILILSYHSNSFHFLQWSNTHLNVYYELWYFSVAAHTLRLVKLEVRKTIITVIWPSPTPAANIISININKNFLLPNFMTIYQIPSILLIHVYIVFILVPVYIISEENTCWQALWNQAQFCRVLSMQRVKKSGSKNKNIQAQISQTIYGACLKHDASFTIVRYMKFSYTQNSYRAPVHIWYMIHDTWYLWPHRNTSPSSPFHACDWYHLKQPHNNPGGLGHTACLWLSNTHLSRTPRAITKDRTTQGHHQSECNVSVIWIVWSLSFC